MAKSRKNIIPGIEKILFIDIETVPEYPGLGELDIEMQELWSAKFSNLKLRSPERHSQYSSDDEAYLKNAGIYSEFGRIICISVGYIHIKEGENILRIKSFAGHDEKELLLEFTELVNKFFVSDSHNFCGHNIKEFDIPYICRRMLINSITLPPALQINAKKPWEVNLLDTMDYWKFGDYKNFTSLSLLAKVLGVETPKDDIDGSMVSEVYYKENDLDRIVHYCQKDVVATAKIWLRMASPHQVAINEVEIV